MENEQAQGAVQTNEAASAAGAGNERERTMSSLLEKLTFPPVVKEATPESKDDKEDEGAEAKETKEGARIEEEGGEEVEIATDEEGERNKAKNFRGRWDHLNEEERRVVELTTKRGLSLSEAYRAVYGTERKKGAVEAAGVTEDAVSGEAVPELLQGVDGEIQASEERLSLLKRQRAEAKGDLEAYDKAVEAYLGERETLQELRLKRRVMEDAEMTRREQAREAATKVASEALADEFPEALVPGTELYEACQEEMAYLEETRNPLKDDPAVEYKVARRLARLMGVGRVRREAAAAAASTGAGAGVGLKRTIRPLPTGGTPVEAPVVAIERRVAGARSPGAMLDLMREYGTPLEALMRRGV